MCCHTQGVHHLAVKILNVALHFQGRLLGSAARRFDQMPRAGEVVGDLRQVFVRRSRRWPLSDGRAAADRLRNYSKLFHWILFRRAVRRRTQDSPQFGP